MRTQHVTIYYNNGTEQDAAISEVRTYARENHAVLHFGRDDGSGWHELIAAPAVSVRSWS